MNEALGNVGATVTYARRRRSQCPPTGMRRSPNWRRRWTPAQVEMLVILGGNPVFAAPADLKFGEQDGARSAWSPTTASTWTRPRISRTGTCRPRMRSRAGATRAAFDGTVTLMQPLIAPMYEGRSAHEMLALFTRRRTAAAPQIVKDYWTRAYSAGAAVDDQSCRTSQRSRTPMRSGSGRCTTASSPARPSPKAGPRLRSAAAAVSRSGRLPHRQPPAPAGRGRARDHLPPGSDDRGRQLRQQRLAAGAAEAADRSSPGTPRRGSARVSRRSAACTTATSSR